MTATRGTKVGYWIATVLFLLPMAGSGIPELLTGGPASSASTLAHLGYPLYLLRILGLAKLLGAAAIVSDRSRTLKEWAYAGYTFDLLGAVASHLIVGDAVVALVPAVMLALVLSSYRLWSRARPAAPAPGRERRSAPQGSDAKDAPPVLALLVAALATGILIRSVFP